VKRNTPSAFTRVSIPKGGPNQLQDPEVFTWGADGFPDEYRGEQAVVYGHWENSIEDKRSIRLSRL